MVTASLTCARLFQAWSWRSWELASLVVLRSDSSSEIQSLKTQWTKWNWKRGRHLFWYWRTFFGNNKARNYAELVNNMLTAFRNLGYNMSIKMHYLFSHMDRFPENLGSMSDEQRDSIRTWKRWRSGIRVAGTRSWWLTTVGIWRETSLPLSIPGVRRNGSSSPEVWTMVKQHAIFMYLPLSMPTI